MEDIVKSFLTVVLQHVDDHAEHQIVLACDHDEQFLQSARSHAVSLQLF